MKRVFICGFILTVVCVTAAFGDTEITPYFYVPGKWEVIEPGDAGFAGSPTEKHGITPLTKAVRHDEEYFGYFFMYDWGAMTGTGTPWEGDYESFHEWADFSDRMEADFRSILEMFGTNLRRQTFCKVPGGEERFALYDASGYADFNNGKYGFVAVSMEIDVALYLTGIIFCDAGDFDANIWEMKEILGLETVEQYEW